MNSPETQATSSAVYEADVKIIDRARSQGEEPGDGIVVQVAGQAAVEASFETNDAERHISEFTD